MSFSVVIPTLNESGTIARAISSAMQAGAAEVIVSDGGSVDGTIEISMKNHATVVNSMAGRGQQLNRGALEAREAILVFLHADNWLSPNCGSQIAQAFSDGVQFCCFQQRINNDRRIFRWIEKGNAFRARVQRLPYGDQGLSMTREFFDQVDGFPAIPLMEDVIFSQRASKLTNPQLLEGPLFVSDRRWTKNGVIRQTFRNWLTMTKFRLGASPEKLAAQYNRANGPIRPGNGDDLAPPTNGVTNTEAYNDESESKSRTKKEKSAA